MRITITQGEKKHLDNTKEAFKFNDKDVSSIIKFASLIPQLILSYKPITLSIYLVAWS